MGMWSEISDNSAQGAAAENSRTRRISLPNDRLIASSREQNPSAEPGLFSLVGRGK